MKTLKKSILFVLVFILMLLAGNTVYGADANLSPSATNVTVGTSVTITASVTSAEAWQLSLVTSGGTLSGTTSSVDAPGSVVTQTVIKATFSASTAGTYTITLSGQVTGSDLVKQLINKPITITVTNPPTPKPTVTPTQTPTEAPPAFTSTNETVFATTDVNVRSSYSTASASLGELLKGESVVRTGITTTKVNGYVWSKVTYNGQVGYIASDFLQTAPLVTAEPTIAPTVDPNATPTPEPKSNDATLKTLSLNGIKIIPDFDPKITSYVANTTQDISEVEVIAEVNDEKSLKEINGNKGLINGENIINVIVTAEDGTIKTYEIKLTKGMEEIPLNALVIMGSKENGEKVEVNLNTPTVEENKVIYNIKLAEYLKSIEILGALTDSTVAYEGTGTFELAEGENKYTIKLTIAKEGAEAKVVEYEITLENPSKVVPVAEPESKTNYKAIIIIAVIVIVAILAITFLVAHFKKNNTIEYAKTDYSFLHDDLDIQTREHERYSMKEEQQSKMEERNTEETAEEINPELEEMSEPKEIKDDNDFGGDFGSGRRKGKHF